MANIIEETSRLFRARGMEGASGSSQPRARGMGHREEEEAGEGRRFLRPNLRDLEGTTWKACKLGVVEACPCGCGSKHRSPKWNPGRWTHGPTPAVPWWLNLTHVHVSFCGVAMEREEQIHFEAGGKACSAAQRLKFGFLASTHMWVSTNSEMHETRWRNQVSDFWLPRLPQTCFCCSGQEEKKMKEAAAKTIEAMECGWRLHAILCSLGFVVFSVLLQTVRGTSLFCVRM